MVVNSTCSNRAVQAHILVCLVQSASQETRYSSSSIELQVKVAYHRIAYLCEAHFDLPTLLFRRLRAATGEHVCRSPFCSPRSWSVWFRRELVLLLAIPVNLEMQCPTSAMQRNRAFCTRVGSLPVTSRSHGQMDNCNLSIMIYIYRSSDFSPRNKIWCLTSHSAIICSVVIETSFIHCHMPHMGMRCWAFTIAQQ